MAVVDVVRILDENCMISDSYHDKISSELSTLGFASRTDEKNLPKILECISTMTSSKIKSKADLSAALTIIDIDEANKRRDEYKSYDETLSLQSVGDFKVNHDEVIKRIKYCKKFNFPYCNDNGVLFREVVSEQISRIYINRYYIFKKEYEKNNYIDFDEFLNNYEDPISEFYSVLQNYSLKNFNHLCEIDLYNEKKIENMINTSDADLNGKLFLAFSNLKDNYRNKFIDLDLISTHFLNISSNEEQRRGQR